MLILRETLSLYWSVACLLHVWPEPVAAGDRFAHESSNRKRLRFLQSGRKKGRFPHLETHLVSGRRSSSSRPRPRPSGGGERRRHVAAGVVPLVHLDRGGESTVLALQEWLLLRLCDIAEIVRHLRLGVMVVVDEVSLAATCEKRPLF